MNVAIRDQHETTNIMTTYTFDAIVNDENTMREFLHSRCRSYNVHHVDDYVDDFFDDINRNDDNTIDMNDARERYVDENGIDNDFETYCDALRD